MIAPQVEQTQTDQTQTDQTQTDQSRSQGLFALSTPPTLRSTPPIRSAARSRTQRLCCGG